MKKMSRLLSLLLCFCLLAGVLAGCSGDSGDSGDSGSSSPGQPSQSAGAQSGGDTGTSAGTPTRDRLVVASQTEPTSLGTADHNAIASDYVNQLIYCGLTRVDENTQLIGDLATSWDQPSDTEWLFHLRENVYFHNGDHMTADDVVASLIWAQDFEPNAAYALTFAETIEAVDEYTVRIVTKEPSAGLLFCLSNHGNFIVPKSLIDSNNNFNENPIGSGPYKFISWSAGEKLEFEAFDQFFEGAPAIKYLTYMVIPESSSRTVALQSGDVDYIIQVSPADYDILAADPNVEMQEKASTTLNYLMLNNAAAPFDDANFRKAVNAAINKEDVVLGAIYGLGTAAKALTPETLPGTVTTNTDDYSVEKALAYLEAWGGDPSAASFTILCSNDTKIKVGEVIQACLLEIGVDVKLESCDTAAYISRTAVGDYQAAIGGYSHSSMFSFANYNYLSAERGGSPRSQAKYDEIDALLEKAGTTTETAAHTAALEELSAGLNDLCIYVPLYLDYVVRAYSTELGGVLVNASNENNWRTFYWKS